MAINKLAKEAFKRNPKAKCVHVVLNKTFIDDMSTAKKYANAKNAKVTSVLRKEYDGELKGQPPASSESQEATKPE